MKWFWIPAVFYLVIQVKSEPTRNDATTIPIKINRIEQLGSGTKICISEAIPAGETYTLSIKSDDQTFNEETSVILDNNCITFKGNIRDLPPNKDFYFFVHSEKVGEENYADGHVQDFPEIPSKASLVTDLVTTDPNDFLLRIEGNNLDKLVFDHAISTLVNDQSISYYSGITGNSYEINACYDTTPENIKVCVVQSLTATETVLTVETATLEINSDSEQANIALKLGNTVDSFDIILSTELISQPILCPATSSPLSCPITRENNNQAFHIRVMQLDADKKITATGTATIQDRDLTIQPLDYDILEGVWTHDFEESKDDKVYQFLRVEDDGKETSVRVDCTELTHTHCYGYIIGTLQVNTMKVRPKNESDFSHTDENQSTYPQPPPTPHQDLKVQILHKSWQQNLKSINSKICFNHANTTENLNFSHYEMLVINKKGQWLKHKTLENYDEGVLCFTPLTINVDDFDVTNGAKVIISQRGIDGITVLASGASDLF